MKLKREIAVAVLLTVLLLATLAGGGSMPGASPVLPWQLELLLWCLVSALAALHRPFGGLGLGLGALALPPAIGRFGAAGAVLVAGVARLLVAVLRHSTDRRAKGGSVRGLAAAGAAAAAAFVGAVVASLDALGEAHFAWRAALPAAAYAVVFAALVVTLGRARIAGRRGPWPPVAASDLTGLGLDVAGWVLGALLADLASFVGWWRVGPILLALALLAAEAARNAIARGASDHRVGDFERLHQAHERILGETSGMAAVAQQILTECSNILPVQWFQLEPEGTEADSGQSRLERRGWSAGPDGVLVPGRPRPEARPPMLPGVHRRVTWRILEESLVLEGETLATVRLWCDPRRIEPDAEALFSTLLPQMASSIHRARLDREARLDPLTDVPVRRLLDSGLQQAFGRCCEEGRSLAVMMCDIDHFKQVNDTHGHAAGDEALILVARALDEERRESDLLARYGGEEFALLLENTSGVAVLQLAERLRLAVEAIDLAVDGKAIPLTLSIGVAAFPDLHIKTASELLLLADAALYEAKRQGRNRSLFNLGRGIFRSATGATLGAMETPVKAPPRIFG